MIVLGVDLVGEERARYERVRAAREKMVEYGVRSPYLRDPYAPPTRKTFSYDISAAILDACFLRDRIRVSELVEATGASPRHCRTVFGELRAIGALDTRLDYDIDDQRKTKQK